MPSFVLFIILVVGFVLLIKGADFFVEGSSATAKKLNVPSLIIGMTIVAMGTSLPETSVSVSASIAGKNGLAISNAVGSNIFNLMVVAGLCAIFCAVPVGGDTLKRDMPFSGLIAVMLLAMGYFGSEVSRIEGVILLAVFALFLFVMIKSAVKARNSSQGGEEDEEIKSLPTWKCIVFIIGGIAAIAGGGKLVVYSASEIASRFGMSDTLIGMTIVALGTSLPELVTSVVAARKKEIDMALGNVVGSNIFNILFVLGIAASISPVSCSNENLIDTAVLIAMTVLVLAFCIPKKRLGRAAGIAMVLIYAAYAAYLFIR